MNIEVPYTLEVFVLGLLKVEEWSEYNRIMLQERLFMARKQISLRWMQPMVPTTNQWIRAVNQIIPYEKIMYEHREIPNKYYKIWDLWCNSPTTLVKKKIKRRHKLN